MQLKNVFLVLQKDSSHFLESVLCNEPDQTVTPLACEAAAQNVNNSRRVTNIRNQSRVVGTTHVP